MTNVFSITLNHHPDSKNSNKGARQGVQYEQRLNKSSFQTGREILTNESLMRRTNNTASKTYLKNLLQTKRIEISKFIHSPSPTKGFTSAKKNFSNDFWFRNDSFSNSGSKKLRRQMFISDHNE